MQPTTTRILLLLSLFLVGASAPAQQTAWPLKVSPNGRYFVDHNGTPVFWLGTTQGELFHGFKLEDAKTFLAESSKTGFVVVQVKLMGGGDGTVPNAYGEKIWINDDSLMPNEAYFRNVDAVVEAARDNNMTILITLYHQLCRKYITLDKARSWAKRVAQRYKDAPNIIWSMTPEAKQSSVPILRELAAGLHEGDGGRHLVSVKPDPSPYSSSFIHNESWLDFNSMQLWNGLRLIYPAVTRDYSLQPAKPILMAEGTYEGTAKYGFLVTPLWIRRQAYYSYLAGGHYTYGYNAHDPKWHVLPIWREALHSPGAAQMGILKKTLLARKEWWQLVPDQSVFASGGHTSDVALAADYANDKERMDYVRRIGVFPLAEQPDDAILHLAARHRDGKWVVVYLADKASFSVNMNKIRAPKVNVFWVDPKTGDTTPGGQQSNTGVKSFSTPDGWEDALLILEAADAPVPASP